MTHDRWTTHEETRDSYVCSRDRSTSNIILLCLLFLVYLLFISLQLFFYTMFPTPLNRQNLRHQSLLE